MTESLLVAICIGFFGMGFFSGVGFAYWRQSEKKRRRLEKEVKLNDRN